MKLIGGRGPVAGAGVIAAGVLALIAGLAPRDAAAAGVDIRLNVPIVKQDMPLDCESAALASAMQYKRVDISQNTVFNELPKDGRPAEVSNGKLIHWGDPYTAFIGNVYGSEVNYTGYGVYYPPIAGVAEKHGLSVDAHGGWTLSQLVSELEAGNPVVVWVPWHLETVTVTSYVAYDGRRVWFSIGEHAQVLIGYDQGAGTITLMDPLSGGYDTYSASLFMTRYDAWHAEGVAVKYPPCPTVGVVPGGLNPLSAAAWSGCSAVPRPTGSGQDGPRLEVSATPATPTTARVRAVARGSRRSPPRGSARTQEPAAHGPHSVTPQSVTFW